MSDGLFEHPKINIMADGWYVVYHNGSVVTEHDVPSWGKVPKKKQIARLGLKWRHKRAEVKDKSNYIPPGSRYFRDIKHNLLTGVVVTGKPQLKERFIGYYSKKGKVKTVVDVITGKWSNRLEPYE